MDSNMLLLIQLLALLPQAIKAGVDVASAVSTIEGIAARGTPPTDDEWAALDRHVADLRAALNTDPAP